MLLPVVQAVTAEAHSQDKLVFAHPQTLEGVQLALDGGVDVLAHTAPQGGAWSPELVKGMVEKGMSLIPSSSSGASSSLARSCRPSLSIARRLRR